MERLGSLLFGEIRFGKTVLANTVNFLIKILGAVATLLDFSVSLYSYSN